jgi:hypothetical protein
MITNSISTTPPDKGDTLADTVCQTYKDNHPKK